MKNRKSFVILGGIFILLLLSYWGISRYTTTLEEKKEAKKEAGKIAITEFGKKLSGIEYTDGRTKFSFVKGDSGEWTDSEDTEFPLDTSYVKAMEKTLGNLDADRELKNADALDSYGLDKPAYTIILTGNDGESKTLFLGNTTNAEGTAYYLTSDGKTVYTVAQDVVTCLQFDRSTLVKRDTFPTISSTTLVSESITKNGETTTYKKADTEALAIAAGGLGVFSFDGYDIADPNVSQEKLAEYGLDETGRTTVTAVYKKSETNKEKKKVTIYVGNIGQGSDGSECYHVQKKGSKIVYLATRKVIDNILNQSDAAGTGGTAIDTAGDAETTIITQ